MRLKVTLTSGTDLVLPIHYNHLLQGLIYRIRGSRELIETGYDCGLGAKNSQGFGMIEVVAASSS